MSLMSKSGSSTSNLSLGLNQAGSGGTQVPASTPNSVPGLEVPTTQIDRLEDLPFVQDPALQRLAFDQHQYPTTLKALQGFMEGHRIPVTYFQQINKQGNDIRTNIADLPNERSVIHTAYRRINRFEITLKDPWTFDYNPETTQASITGIALLYPGMNPTVGDLFLTAAGDNKMAIFRVSTILPMSWYNQRAYQIGYYFFSYPSATEISVLTAGTVETMFFDKANYLGDTTSLLVEDKYHDLQVMRAMRNSLSLYYFRNFYDDALGSFFRPDGIYDPYLVKYMASMCSFEVTKRRPRQLFALADYTYPYCVLSRLNDPDARSVADLTPLYQTQTYIGRSLDVALTTLLNRCYLTMAIPFPDPNLAPPMSPYIFSTNFYNGLYLLMTPFEQMVYQAIVTQRFTDTKTLIDVYLRPYLSLSPMDQFYQIPFYLYLIDVAIRSISRVIP